jgi:CBS domain-containing protein
MKLSDVMHRDVQTISEDTTVRDAAKQMSSSDIGALPVCEDGHIAGMLTDRDIVVRSLARGDDPDSTKVGDIMTHEVEWCYDDAELEEASQKMRERQIQRLVVLDHDEHLAGIVSIADLARARGEAGRTIEEIKAPTKPTAAGK